jgi:hypothetical protein
VGRWEAQTGIQKGNHNEPAWVSEEIFTDHLNKQMGHYLSQWNQGYPVPRDAILP